MHDAIVVGGRCAGAATALLLARRGHDVLLMDRTTFPSDTLCTHQAPAPALAMLSRWGLLDQVADSCPSADHLLTRDGERAEEVPNAVVDGANLSCAPRRRLLDAVLLDAARAAGTEVRQELTVRDLVWEGGVVVGVVAQGADGHSVCETARVVIGADGRQSLVARIAGASTLQDHPSTACCYYAYWEGLGGRSPEWHATAGYSIGVFPTCDSLAVVVARAPVSDWARFKRAPEEVYRSIADRLPDLAHRLAGGRRQSRFFGTADLGGVVRQPSGPGWLLVGDAVHHDDPLVWSGISAAFVDAQVAAAILDEGLSGRMPLETAQRAHHQCWEGAWADSWRALDRIRRGPGSTGWAVTLDGAQQLAADPVRKLLASSMVP